MIYLFFTFRLPEALSLDEVLFFPNTSNIINHSSLIFRIVLADAK